MTRTRLADITGEHAVIGVGAASGDQRSRTYREGMTTTVSMTEAEPLDHLAAALGDILRRGNDVREWPEDEAALFRSPGYRDFMERAERQDLFMRRKVARLIVHAMLDDPELVASVLGGECEVNGLGETQVTITWRDASGR